MVDLASDGIPDGLGGRCSSGSSRPASRAGSRCGACCGSCARAASCRSSSTGSWLGVVVLVIVAPPAGAERRAADSRSQHAARTLGGAAASAHGRGGVSRHGDEHRVPRRRRPDDHGVGRQGHAGCSPPRTCRRPGRRRSARRSADRHGEPSAAGSARRGPSAGGDVVRHDHLAGAIAWRAIVVGGRRSPPAAGRHAAAPGRCSTRVRPASAVPGRDVAGGHDDRATVAPRGAGVVDARIADIARAAAVSGEARRSPPTASTVSGRATDGCAHPRQRSSR